jgi:cysteine desulfuration protein SufE
VTLTLQELAENFDLLDDWEARYDYIIELGRGLPPMPDAARTEANRVRGCQSQVWLDAHFAPGPRLHFLADSDSQIVKGLAAILVHLHDGLAPHEILALPVEETFTQLDLKRFLSANRGNGLSQMIARIRALAQATSQQ